jgi:hypothetical protein
MKRYFNTKEKALEHFKYRKKCAHERIKKRNDYILGDASFVYRNLNGKWIVFIQIITLQMMHELENLQNKYENIYPLIPFTSEEKVIRDKNIIKKLKKKYKTLDIQDYTINKTL